MTTTWRGGKCSSTTTRAFFGMGAPSALVAVKVSEPPAMAIITSPGSSALIGVTTRPVKPVTSCAFTWTNGDRSGGRGNGMVGGVSRLGYRVCSGAVPIVPPGVRREALLPLACGAIAAVLVVVLLTFLPLSGDAPLHLFQTWLYR